MQQVLHRPPNSELRTREHLTQEEVDLLLSAAKKSPRNAHRNYCLVLLMFRHGLRVSEAIALQWSDVNFKSADLYVHRMKQGKPSTQPLTGAELRALRQLKREYPDSSYLFVSERQAPLNRHSVGGLIKGLGQRSGLEFSIHPHMLRHACGYALACKGTDTRVIQDYLGHQNIQHTVRYTELAPGRFRGIFKD